MHATLGCARFYVVQDLPASAIRDARNKQGWSQQVLATKAGISLRTLVSVERGKDCNLSTLRKLAAALGQPLGVLIGEPALREAHGLCTDCDVPTLGPCEHRPEAVAS